MNTIKKTTLLIFVMAITEISFCQWSSQTSGTNQQLIGIQFLNENVGYSSSMLGTTVKTTDGGANWSLFPSFTGYFMHFMHTDTAFGCFNDTLSHFQKSTDGGITWVNKLSTPYFLGKFHFPSSTVGYATMFNATYDSLQIYKSIDGGESWNNIWAYPSAIVTCIYFIDANTGFYTNEVGQLYRTANGGDSWDLVFSGIMNYAIYFPSPSIGYGATLNGFIKSIDGGITWTETPLPYGGAFYSIDCPNINTCHIVGGDGWSTGALLKTTNGGANWTETPTTCNALNSVDFVNDTVGYTCGLGGTILKYGASSSALQQEGLLENFKIYPNPAKDFINLLFENSNADNFNAIIYNSLGEIVKQVYNINSNTVKINLQNLIPGLYTIQLHTVNKKYRGSHFIVK